jgi:hypothetical protein
LEIVERNFACLFKKTEYEKMDIVNWSIEPVWCDWV